MKRKTNTLPEFKHTPAAPQPIKKTLEETAAEVLASLRQFEPEGQNQIIAMMLKEMAIDRFALLKTAKELNLRAEKSADVFFSLTRNMEEVLKEMAAKQ